MYTQDNNRGRLFLYLFGGLVVVLVIALGVVYFYKSSKVARPVELMYTNITDSGLSVVWRTNEESKSKLFIREKGGKWMSEAFYDDRDTELDDEGKVILKKDGEISRYTHHVSVGGLKPETEYEIALNGFLTKVTKDKDGNDLATIKTGKMLEELYTPDPAYGKVLYEDSKVPNEGIVFLTVTNATSGVEKSNILSTYLSDIATWSIDVNNFRTSALDNRIIINNINDREKITFWNQDGSKYSQVELPDYDKPTQDLLLKEEFKISKFSTKVQAKSMDCGQHRPVACNCNGQNYTGCISNDNWTKFAEMNGNCEQARNRSILICNTSEIEQTGEKIVIPETEKPRTTQPNPSITQPNTTSCSYYSNTQQLIYYNSDGTKATQADTNNGRYRLIENGCCSNGGICQYNNSDSEAIANAQEQVIPYSTGNPGIDYSAVSTASGTTAFFGTTYVTPVQSGVDIYGAPKYQNVPITVHFGLPNKQSSYCTNSTEEGQPCICLDGVRAYVINWGENDKTCNLAKNNNSIVANSCKYTGTDFPQGTYLPGTGYKVGGSGDPSYHIFVISRNQSDGICTITWSSSEIRPNIPKIDELKIGEGPIGMNKLISVAKAEDINNKTINISNSGNYVTYMGDNVLSEFTVVLNEGQTAQIKLFADLNANGTMDKDEPVIDDYTQIKIEQESSAVGYNLQNGWNLVNFPLVSNKGTVTASDLIEYFNKQGANIVHVAKYTDAGFVMYSKREDGVQYANDFNILPGQSYFVLNYTAKSVAFEGNKFAEPVPLKFTNGWNLVGVVSPGKSYTANSLLDAINTAGFKASTISNYEAGRYTSVIKESGTLYGNDYKVLDTKGYFIRVEEGGGSSFTP